MGTAARNQIGLGDFAAMEFIDGQTLQEWLNGQGRLSVGDALHIALLCSAVLGHADRRGIIHRDVKPSNALIRVDGIVKIADFGLVRLLEKIRA